MLNFGNDLEPIFIFAGLAFLLLIGPLLRWHVAGMTQVDFKLPPRFYLEIVPFALFFTSSFFIDKNWFEANNKEAVIVFASVLIFIYLHFAFYIFIAYRQLKRVRNDHVKALRTKSQKAIILWLQLLIIGFVVIWVSYFLNIIENAVPYVVGPLMYSAVVYFLSLKAYQLKITDMDGKVFKMNDDIELFAQISKIISTDKFYLEPNVSLSSLSKLINKSTQKTSEVINQYSKKNFNDFINYYRVGEAKKMLSSGNKYTISTIAYDSGFSSLSSFNSAFKKFEGKTPSLYRKENSL
ncbi:helix-turn-helix domain-containing protein [Aggregatimonas sangjinii]|nr:helix-turn-helix domain-containing protein [Aggregatimonas sangjinii]